MTRVLSFGGPAMEAVFEAISVLTPQEKVKIYVVAVEDEERLAYKEFEGSFEEALASLAKGCNGSIQLQWNAFAPVLAAIYRPGFASERLLDWSALIEGDSLDLDKIFGELLSNRGLSYIAHSRDESVDIDAEYVTVANFPWSDWRLEAGAVRDDKGVWMIRRHWQAASP